MNPAILALVVLVIMLAVVLVSELKRNGRLRNLLMVTTVKNKDRKPLQAESYVRIYGIRKVGMYDEEETFPMLFTQHELQVASERARKQPEDAPLQLVG